MKNFQENIVPAFNQNKGDVFLYDNELAKLKILFVGNSITKHAPKADIGWYNDCGMAASSADKDYVHLLVKKLMKYDENVSYGIAQVAQYERTFFEKTAKDDYQSAADYNADIVIMFFGANVAKEYDDMENPPKTFGEAYEDMRNLLSQKKKEKVFLSMGFYIKPKLETEKRAVAQKYGDVFIDTSDIYSREDTRGKFNHPNDVGMQAIADRFWEHLEPVVKQLLNK